MTPRSTSPLLPSRRATLLALAGIALVQAPLAARAGFNFFTSEYTVSREELQAQVVRHFPVSQRYAQIFTVNLREPQLSLDAANNRAAITALMTIGSALLQPSSVEGVVSVSSALRYDAATRALRLDNPKADRLELQGMTGRDAERLQQIGGLVAQELLRDYALRTFTAEELTVGRKTYEIGDITVQQRDIKVQLK
ncbi:DUF1439 domain-containing protein [Variovorax ginsengisoli]|uniref:DUF1439 domain-containing protein n=1 Tax=Variovorax ginsengisoli TaxID=363844 RepID=A0ABT9S4K4_9BURK|nr:DUF1439 domain-containing protein [Variovorax ginsengisoli]MDP9899271.1 hypothetical protein [Variovorax ginsengisoli]